MAKTVKATATAADDFDDDDINVFIEEDDTKKGFERIEKMIGSSDEDSQAAAARTVDDMKKESRYPSEGRPESKDREEIMDILNELHEMFEEEVADDKGTGL